VAARPRVAASRRHGGPAAVQGRAAVHGPELGRIATTAPDRVAPDPAAGACFQPPPSAFGPVPASSRFVPRGGAKRELGVVGVRTDAPPTACPDVGGAAASSGAAGLRRRRAAAGRAGAGGSGARAGPAPRPRARRAAWPSPSSEFAHRPRRVNARAEPLSPLRATAERLRPSVLGRGDSPRPGRFIRLYAEKRAPRARRPRHATPAPTPPTSAAPRCRAAGRRPSRRGCGRR
jgi:hypothetical protein